MMKHARKDYDRFQDPDGKIPVDEPVLLLRAQDFAAANTARFWADEAERCGANTDIVTAVRSHADAMDAWPTKKIPDL